MKKSDLRVIKTKSKIKNAYNTLHQKFSFDDISITNICNEAGVTRKTFYNNFKDKYELCSEILEDLTRDYESLIFKKIKDSQSIRDIKDILDLVIDKISELCSQKKQSIARMNIYDNNSYYILIETFAKKKFKALLTLIVDHYELKNWKNYDLMGTFVVGGFLTCLLNWAKKTDSGPFEIRKNIKEILDNLFYVNVFIKKVEQ